MRQRGWTVQRKLAVFGVIAFFSVVIVSLSYLQVPRQLGYGQMSASTTLPQTGGLGANARVTYRGIEVGKVTSVDLTPAGAVVARLSLLKDADLPAGVESQVHSASVIGEQYLELLPTDESVDGTGASEAGQLKSGAQIPVAKKNAVPVDAGTLLETLDGLIRSVDANNLRTTVDELSTAFAGARQPLSDLLDGGNALVGDAQANLQQTKALINNLGPVLQTQTEVAPQLRQISTNLRSFTGQLKVSDTALRSLLDQTPAATDQLIALVKDIHPALPQVLANLAATGEVLRVYLPGIKQTLVLYPALLSTLMLTAERSSPPGRSVVYFHVNINDPKGCTQGFKGRLRDPRVTESRKDLDIGWCKISQTANTSVRGSRNLPCPNNNLRSATSLGCGLDYSKKPRVTMTSYNPRTGNFVGPDGKTYTIDMGKRNTAPGSSPYSSGLLTALGSR
jgi:phospholipid/cholesterol/gamma-HCH transport system substrate-binding protein